MLATTAVSLMSFVDSVYSQWYPAVQQSLLELDTRQHIPCARPCTILRTFVTRVALGACDSAHDWSARQSLAVGLWQWYRTQS